MITPIRIPLKAGSDAEVRMKRFLRDKVRSIRIGLKEIHENRLVRWRKNYEAIPAEAIRQFPWENASNLVVPIIAIHSDTLLARTISAILKTQPPWVVREVAAYVGMKELEGIGKALETFFSYVAFEPKELDLFRVYHEWQGETIRYGTSVLKSPWVHEIEDYVVPAGDGSPDSPGFSFQSRTKYMGPRPEKVRFNDFGIAPDEKTIEGSDFMYHRIRIKREKLEERAFKKIYDPEVVRLMINQPDRTSPDYVQQEAENDTGAKSVSGYGWAEWDIYECWFKYRVSAGQGIKSHYVNCIVWYHERTNSILRAFFDYYPERPFVASRLFFRDDMFHGYGFCEMLEPLTEEISTMHNYRIDNQLVGNTKVWRVSEDSKIWEGYRIYPGAKVPGEKDEIEAMQHGEIGQVNIDAERVSMDLADKRTGVSPPIQGAGAGFNTKRGVYTAMGTLSLMQDGNNRTDLNITDMRYAHTKAGRIFGGQYGEFGIGDREEMFGELGHKIKRGLEELANGRIALPITASTASINREVEKQNDLLLSQLLDKHYQMQTTMLQAAADPRIPPNISQYIYAALQAKEVLMKQVLRNFQQDEVDKMVPQATPPTGPQPGVPPGAQPPGGGPGGQPGVGISGPTPGVGIPNTSGGGVM